jgi:ATP-binding cassette subfamily B (MDR/TAP) protein 1
MIDLVQQAISEKVPLAVCYTSAFVTGFVLAFARSWKLALALSSIFFWIMITGALMMGGLTKSSTYVVTSSCPSTAF